VKTSRSLRSKITREFLVTERVVICSNGMRKRVKAPILRFWAKVDQGGPDDCWLWTSTKNAKGYGTIGLERNLSMYAHRFSYVIAYGDIPDAQFVCHRCDNPSCVNPRHLWLGSSAENTADMMKKGRHGSTDQNRLKVTSEQVAQLRQMHLDGVPQPELAEKFGLSLGYVSSVVRGHVRKGDPGPISPWRHQEVAATHCHAGHDLAVTAAFHGKRKKRVCRVCHTRSSARYRQRKCEAGDHDERCPSATCPIKSAKRAPRKMPA
jgi:hypothetical protein